MNLVGHMINFCEAHMASQKIWSHTTEVHILVNFKHCRLLLLFMFAKGKPFRIINKTMF